MADQDSRIDHRELAWAAGLFEGEGCITHNGHRGAKLTPKLVLVSSDEDVVMRFTRVVGVGRLRRQCISTQKHGKAHYKDTWEWRVIGFEKTQFVIALLWKGLGRRRRERAVEILRWNGKGAPEHAFEGAKGRIWSTRGITRQNIDAAASTP